MTQTLTRTPTDADEPGELAPSVRIEIHGRLGLLILDRPPLNILDLEMIDQLRAALDELATHDLQLVRVRSASPSTFSAGVSIQDHTPDKIDAMLDGFHGCLERLRGLEAVTVAEVDGRCLGGGMELALACDIVLASESARFAQPEIQLGCFPPYAAALYPRRIGYDRTVLLLTTGLSLDGREAERWGLVTRCFADEGFAEGANEIAESILSKSAPVARVAKRAARAGDAMPLDQALAETERLYREELGGLADLLEGIEAFLTPRPPEWKHR